ncbi:MAG: hypothetical protein AMXMBFR84_34270 [Candidatus Hydrogenedentota bacterium]
MQTLLILVPLVILVVTIFYGVFYSLVRAWLDYRVKLSFLEKLEKHPDLLAAKDEVQGILSQGAVPARYTPRQDYALTGLILAIFGIVFALLGYNARIGQFAVGATLGGIVCLMIGILLGLFGLVIRFLARGDSAKSSDPVA